MKTSKQNNRPAQLSSILKQLRSDDERAEFLNLYDGLHADFPPVGRMEESIVARVALVSLRIRHCFAMETEVLRRGMDATRTEGDNYEMAVGRAFIRDFQGSHVMDKISRCQSQLQESRSRNLKLLQHMQELRKRRPRPVKSAPDVEFELIKPCTSVVQ